MLKTGFLVNFIRPENRDNHSLSARQRQQHCPFQVTKFFAKNISRSLGRGDATLSAA